MDANTIIDAMGGTNEVARLCDLTPGAVSQWRDNGIPKPWLKFFEVVRPDVFRPVRASKRSKVAV